MRRIAMVVIAGTGVLTSAGVGLAHLIEDGTQKVSATFTASKERADIRSCVGTDGMYEIVRGRYSGASASSQPVLNGRVVLIVSSVFNRTEGIGWMRGSMRVFGADHAVQARLVGTLTQGAADSRVLDGFVDGPAGGHSAALFGNVTASFTGNGGFAAGKIGEGGTNVALIAGRVCKRPANRVEATGRITALTSSSITIQRRKNVPPLSCQIRAGISPSTSGLRVGDTVEVVCGSVDGTVTLLQVKKKRDDDDD